MTMKQYLILAAFASAAVCSAQEAPPAAQRVAEARPVAPATAVSASPYTPRKLSEQERAELRRQLYQYSHSRLPAKGS